MDILAIPTASIIDAVRRENDIEHVDLKETAILFLDYCSKALKNELKTDVTVVMSQRVDDVKVKSKNLDSTYVEILVEQCLREMKECISYK